MNLKSRSRQGLALVTGLALILPVMMGQGCPSVTPGSGTPGAPTVTVQAPSIDQNVAVGTPVTLVYNISSLTTVTASAFYDRDGVANTGDEVTFITGLPTGQSKYTQLLTTNLAPGAYRVGVSATNSSGTTTAYAAGRVVVQGTPLITFTSPAGALRVAPGVSVPITFNAGVNDFSWKTFYDTDGILNGNEVTIDQGSSAGSPDVATAFETAGFSTGTFYVGVTISTTTGGTGSGYAPGTVTLVGGSFIQVLAPTVGLVATPGTPIQIIVAANDPANTASTIRLFYDTDNVYGNGGEVTITSIPVSATGATWDTSNAPNGAYYVGAQLVNGLTPPLVSYSAGPVQIGQGTGSPGTPGSGNSALALTTPPADATILQNRVFRISWTTNLKVGEGTVTVFREPDLNKDGVPDGEVTRVTIGSSGIDATVQRVDFDTAGVKGKFFIGATLTPVSGSPVTAYSPGTLTVRPLIFWTGDLLTKKDDTGKVINQTGPFQGAVFQGFNFRDNLGSAMVALPDIDSPADGRSELLLGAQYAKSFYSTESGRGAGEAYLFYGQASQRFSGTIGVNSAGITRPGLVFSGIAPNPFPGDVDDVRAKTGNAIPYTVDGEIAPAYASEGLRSITLLPDQDLDGIPEIMFGFPYCNSYSLLNLVADGIVMDQLAGIGRLENNGHFLRGGVVTISSWNPLLWNRNARSRRLDRVMELAEVGQVFDTMTVGQVNGLATGASGPEVRTITRNGRPFCEDYSPHAAGAFWTFPCDGFWQNTEGFVSPPRLADPQVVAPFVIPGGVEAPTYNCSSLWNTIDLAQVDPPPGPTDPNFNVGGYIEEAWTLTQPGNRGDCIRSPETEPSKAPFGTMYVGGTGFYSTGTGCGARTMANPMEPYGFRLLGQETTQPTLGTKANRFAHSVSVTGRHLLVGAPNRSMLGRTECGVIYMVQTFPSTLQININDLANINAFPYSLPPRFNTPFDVPDNGLPYPHNWIVQDAGFYVYDAGCQPLSSYPPTPSPTDLLQNHSYQNITNPIRVIGAAAYDHIGEVTGANDINGDTFPDFIVGGPGTNGGRGAVYVVYRRAAELTDDYMLDRLQLAPSNSGRLNGLMIVGEPGEQLGTALAAGGSPINSLGAGDDFNNDGFSDALIGSPRANPAAGYQAGQVFVLFGGKNLLNPAGGTTIAALRASGDGMLITGAHAGDMAGATIANAGDVNGDGIADILIAAPEASPRFDTDGDGFDDSIGLDLDGDLLADDLDGDGTPDDMTNAGLVYVVFGGKHLKGTISLAQIGTGKLPSTTDPGWGLPGLTFVGRKGGDHMGGGYTQPSNPNVPESGLLARGVTTAGDLDGDNRADLLVGSILADPDGKTDAGEVYVIYGLTP